VPGRDERAGRRPPALVAQRGRDTIGLGIAWASIRGVPCIMATRMVPSGRYGVYTGIITMMIVPVLIQTPTSGAVHSSIQGDGPTDATTFAGVLLAPAALAMQWIKEPPIVRDVDEVLAMPAGTHRPAGTRQASSRGSPRACER
jgi:maltose/moltooligosaccharide transporter